MENYLTLIKTTLKINTIKEKMNKAISIICPYIDKLKQKLAFQKKAVQTADNLDILMFDPVLHSLDLFLLYPEYVKDSNIESLSFREFYWSLLKYIETGESIVFTIIDTRTRNVMGFIVGEEVNKFILNAHIVIYKKYRNLYNAIKASQKAINLVFKHNYKQIIAEVNKSNKNVKVLLKKLGFELWGTGEKTEVYSIIKAHGRW